MQRLLLAALGLGVLLGTGFYYLQGAPARAGVPPGRVVTAARGANPAAPDDSAR